MSTRGEPKHGRDNDGSAVPTYKGETLDSEGNRNILGTHHTEGTRRQDSAGPSDNKTGASMEVQISREDTQEPSINIEGSNDNEALTQKEGRAPEEDRTMGRHNNKRRANYPDNITDPPHGRGTHAGAPHPHRGAKGKSTTRCRNGTACTYKGKGGCKLTHPSEQKAGRNRPTNRDKPLIRSCQAQT